MIRSRDTLVAAGVYAAAALVCTRIPLLRTPGYEFAFVFALIASLVNKAEAGDTWKVAFGLTYRF